MTYGVNVYAELILSKYRTYSLISTLHRHTQGEHNYQHIY